MRHEGLYVRVEPIEFIQYRAGVEWLLPTAVVAYLVKPYFESLLKEMGKDHYHLLIRGLKGVYARILQKYGDRIKNIGSNGKVNENAPNYSPAFSIEAEASRGHRFKLLIQSDIDEEMLEIALGRFLDLLSQEHGIAERSNVKRPILAAKPISRIVLVALNHETLQLEVIDVVPKRETHT